MLYLKAAVTNWLVKKTTNGKMYFLCFAILFYYQSTHSQSTCWCYEYRYETLDTFSIEMEDTIFFERPFEIKMQMKYIYDDPFIIMLPGKLDNGKFFDITLPMQLNVNPMDTGIFYIPQYLFYNKKTQEYYQICYNNKAQNESLIKHRKGKMVELIRGVKIHHASSVPEVIVIPELALYKLKGMGQMHAETYFKKARLMKYNSCDCLLSSLKQRLYHLFSSDKLKAAKINCQFNPFLERHRFLGKIKPEKE